MKHKVIFFAILLMTMIIPHGVSAQDTNYNFAAVSPSGHMLYYYVVDSNNYLARELGHPCAVVVSPMWGVNNDDFWAGFTKPTGNLIIPDSIVYSDGSTFPVSILWINAFSGCSGLTSVTIPNTIERAENCIFDGCTGLTSPVYNNTIFIHMPPSYSGSYSIPDGIESIHDYAFKNCNGLTSLSIPNTVVEIGRKILENTNLTSISIPNSVDWCYASFWGSSITSPVYNNHLFAYLPSTYSGTYTVPEGITGVAVGAILSNDFLTSITFPSTLEKIGENFYECPNLSDITMLSSVPEFIDVYDFYTDATWHVPCRYYMGYYIHVMDIDENVVNRIVGFGESNFSDTVVVTLCENDFPYSFAGTQYVVEGFYTINQIQSAGCDSMTIDLHIIATPSYMYIVDSFEVCTGVPLEDQFTGDTLAYLENINQEITYYGSAVHWYGTDGVWIIDIPYNDMLSTTILGCDSSYYRRIVYYLDEAPQICMVSVNENHNEVIWNKDARGLGYNIYREGDVAGQFDLVATVPFEEPSRWVDMDSRPTNRSYRYKIASVNVCGESELSTEHKTCHLTINQGQGNRWNLVWTEYEGTEFLTYIIYRGTNQYEIEEIDRLPVGGNTTYTDDTAPEGDVYYQVGIVPAVPCNPSKAGNVILSNIATNGILEAEDIDINGIRIYAKDNHIIVDGAEGMEIGVYDMLGRPVSLTVPTAGVYMVRVGDLPARRVVVVR